MSKTVCHSTAHVPDPGQTMQQGRLRTSKNPNMEVLDIRYQVFLHGFEHLKPSCLGAWTLISCCDVEVTVV